MDYRDAVNGSFELGGALSTSLNVRQLWIDRRIAGVHWAPTVYFFLWGCWNVFYYPHLGQWASTAGGVCLLLVNAAWIGSLVWFTSSGHRERP